MSEVLFPRTVDREASAEEYATQQELARWVFDAMATELATLTDNNSQGNHQQGVPKSLTVEERRRESVLKSEQNEVRGVLSDLTDIARGATPATTISERSIATWQES